MNFTAQLLDAGRSEKLEVLTCYCTSCEHNSLSGLFIALSDSSFLLLEISCDNNSVNTTWNRLKLFQCQPYERPRASESRIPQATKGSQLLCISPLPTGCTVFLCWGLIFFYYFYFLLFGKKLFKFYETRAAASPLTRTVGYFIRLSFHISFQ